MTSLQNKLRNLFEPFLELDCAVTHYERRSSFPYVVWAEDGEDESLHADNHKAEQQLTGTVNFFTKDEFDPLADDIQEILQSERVTWTLDLVQFEEETNLIHYTWRWRTV